MEKSLEDITNHRNLPQNKISQKLASPTKKQIKKNLKLQTKAKLEVVST